MKYVYILRENLKTSCENNSSSIYFVITSLCLVEVEKKLAKKAHKNQGGSIELGNFSGIQSPNKNSSARQLK